MGRLEAGSRGSMRRFQGTDTLVSNAWEEAVIADCDAKPPQQITAHNFLPLPLGEGGGTESRSTPVQSAAAASFSNLKAQ